MNVLMKTGMNQNMMIPYGSTLLLLMVLMVSVHGDQLMVFLNLLIGFGPKMIITMMKPMAHTLLIVLLFLNLAKNYLLKL